MQIVCVSRGTQSGGVQLAERLASKLGCDCIAREDLTDAATRAGIPVGKLEMAALRRRPLSEQMAIEKERYKAFMTATLCERALQRSLVYHGRTGHAVLPGVLHVLRVRAIMDPESRIAAVTQSLGLSRKKAQSYVDQVDEDRHRWARTLHSVDWIDPENYDVVVNLSHMSAENAAAGLIAMSQLPDFQVSPATRRVVEDLYLGARCRLAVAAHQRTRQMDVKVRAERGRVSITYLPRDAASAEAIPEILQAVAGVDEILCTMASANLLWIQERFDPESPSLSQIIDLAGKWNAAVELVQLVEGGGAAPTPSAPAAETGADASTGHGGILDDAAEETESGEDEGLRQTRARLIAAGRAGGSRLVPGGPREVLNTMDPSAPYSLVVVGEVHLAKSASVQKRLSREMVAYIADHLRIPVIEAGEMQTQYLFGPRQWWALIRFGLLAAVLATLVFTNQREILDFLTREGAMHRLVAVISLFIVVPLFAWAYGSFTRYFLRLLRFE